MKTNHVIVALILLCAPVIAQTRPFSGRVIRCYDGDTITVEYERLGRTQQRNVRLAGIDAPEARGGQPFYAESRDVLRGLLLGATVTILPRGRDTRWNRMIGRVLIGGQDAGLRQVSVGAAWYYSQYARSLTTAEKIAYGDAERKARSSKYGIWSEDDPIPPWQWRKARGRAR